MKRPSIRSKIKEMRFYRLTYLIIALISAFSAKAQEAGDDPWAEYDEIVYMDYDLDKNIDTPVLRKSDKHAIRKYMRSIADQLVHAGYSVELDRDEEVIVVIVPVEQLFLPNDTLLSRRAPGKLTPLVKLLKDPGMYKVVYTVHSDNTGTEAYNMELSQQRVNTIYDWMLDKIDENQIVIPYALGDTDPIEENNTREGRAANRRVEFYLIPGPEMILKARSNSLK